VQLWRIARKSRHTATIVAYPKPRISANAAALAPWVGNVVAIGEEAVRVAGCPNAESNGSDWVADPPSAEGDAPVCSATGRSSPEDVRTNRAIIQESQRTARDGVGRTRRLRVDTPTRGLKLTD